MFHRPFFFCGRRPLPFGGSHLRLPSGPAGIRTTTGSLSALARPTPYQLSHRVAYHVSPSVSPFFSPLSLRHGFVVVCFEVTICELLCLDGFRHVISGILAGGIPGFRVPFFSVQRLHGFRQVVTHVQPQQKDEL